MRGESLAGLFVTDTLPDAPTLFDDYIAISPSLWWGAGRIARNAPSKLAGQGFEGRRVYMALAHEGAALQAGVDALRIALEVAPPLGLEFAFANRTASETHATICPGEALAAFRCLYPMPPWEGETPWWMSPDGVPSAPTDQPASCGLIHRQFTLPQNSLEKISFRTLAG
ncbi:MAG: hypothetical protein WEA77_08845 [Hyphomonas sp.]|uniref:hypothetical protein n=1 Tax=Hyphomonas sp. TaxID=87 RepID=UPI0034A01069